MDSWGTSVGGAFGGDVISPRVRRRQRRSFVHFHSRSTRSILIEDVLRFRQSKSFSHFLWMALFSVRSERLLEDCLRYDLRCRWFVGLPLEQDAWDHSTFTKARDSLLLEKLARLFFERHLEFLRAEGLLSSEHLSIDGTLLSAWASHKSLVKRSDLDKNGQPLLRRPEDETDGWTSKEKRDQTKHTYPSPDPEARLASKRTGAKLCHELHVVAENRNNFAVAMMVTPPTGTSERDAAEVLIAKECDAGRKPSTLC